MNTKALYIVQAVIVTIGIIFLIMSIISTSDNRYLTISLGCIAVSNLINIRRKAEQKK
ncbi:MAG: hypothetical protein J6X85_06990 [Ruminococcus sp.]|nr:hypothetical protein [Ruminococcus sp.]